MPAGVDSNGEQDSGGGEPGEGSVATGASGDGSEMPDVTKDEAVVDARRRIRAVKRTRYRSPPTPIGAMEIALAKAMPNVKSVAGEMQGNASLDPGATVPAAIVRISGFDPDWPDMTGWKTIEGGCRPVGSIGMRRRSRW